MKLKELLLTAEDHGIRMEQSQRINLFFDDSLLWRTLILRKSGVEEEAVEKTVTQIKEKITSRDKKLHFIENTALLVSDLFHMPLYEISPINFHTLTLLAFSESPVPLENLPAGWDRLNLVTRLIRVADNCPEDIGHQMLERLGKTLNTEMQSAGNGIKWNSKLLREKRLASGEFSPALPPSGVIFTRFPTL